MITNRTIDLIKVHEGFRGKPYTCTAGKTTIGYGRNLTDNPLTQEEGEYLLRRDLAFAEKDARVSVREFDTLNEVRQAVLIDMAFNLGKARLLGFKRFLESVNRKEWPVAANEMLDSKWAEQVKGRAIRLAKMMEKGEWVA